MAALMWCPNCKQNVNPQKEKSNRGCAFIVLLLLGIVLFFFNIFAGIIVLGVAGLYLIFGLLFEVARLATKSHCPICKATNLMEEKQEQG